MSSHYVYDKDDFKFRRQRRSLRSTLLRVLKYFLASVSLAVLYYIIFALVFSTDKERRLRSENRMYEKLYPEMEQERRLLEDVVAGLEAKDNMIYNDLFQTDVLTFGSQTSEYLSESDSMEVEDIVRHSEQVYEALDEKAGEISESWLRGMCSCRRWPCPSETFPILP